MLAWRANNPEKVKVWAKRWNAKVYKDPVRTLLKRKQSQIRSALRYRPKGSGAHHKMTGLDFTAQQLREHIQRQFTKRMSWENIRMWEVDHIIPISNFDITGPDCPEFKAAWCLQNLRPVWRKVNLDKGSERTHIL